MPSTLAGYFVPHFAIAAGEDEIEIRSVLDIEGIKDFIDPDDYKDSMNDSLYLHEVKDAILLDFTESLLPTASIAH